MSRPDAGQAAETIETEQGDLRRPPQSGPEPQAMTDSHETMTKAGYARRLAGIQAELVERSKAEDARHDAELRRLRAEFQRKCLALRDEFEPRS